MHILKILFHWYDLFLPVLNRDTSTSIPYQLEAELDDFQLQYCKLMQVASPYGHDIQQHICDL